MEIKIVRLEKGKDLPLPAYQTVEASGMDLYACVEEDIILLPLERKLVPTGIKLAIPSGYEGQVRPRSGLANKHGITVLNTPGTIDADYRGEIGVILYNSSKDPFVIKRKERIAQIVFQKIEKATIVEIEEDELETTARGEGGFGHTGKQ